MNELVRHHQFVEQLEGARLKLEQQREERESKSAKGKIDELDYKMKLLEQYKKLKDDYQWTNAQIVAFCPDMRMIVEAEEKTEEMSD